MRANPITPIKEVRVMAEKEAAKGLGAGFSIEQLCEFESVKEGTRQVVKELEEAKARILSLETKKIDGKK